MISTHAQEEEEEEESKHIRIFFLEGSQGEVPTSAGVPVQMDSSLHQPPFFAEKSTAMQSWKLSQAD